MRTEQPLWGRGIMISPQHFQQQAAYAAWSAECIARLGLAHPWGVIEAAFEPDVLKLGRLQARHLHIRFPDGTLIDTNNADDLPPVLALESEYQDAVVVLALPLLRANGGNCLKPDEVAERPVRYRQRWRDVRNTFGDDTRQIAVMQPELTLRFAHQNNSDYLTCPVARLQQDSQGNWALDETWLPPLLALQGSLSLWPEVVRDDALRTAGALLLIRDSLETEPETSQPELSALYSALESRLMKAGGVDAVVPQNAGNKAQTSLHNAEPDAVALSRITSGQDLLAQARTLTGYLREQPDGWLAAHRLMKSLRHDTLRTIPAPNAEGKTRIEPPRADQRAMLKRLYLQQSWLEILEQADSTFSRGANHLWLDLQWYIHQALVKSGQPVLADIIIADLKGLLRRLTGLETLAFNDGTPFADEVTLNWINQSVLDEMSGWRDEPVSAVSDSDNDILALEPEALEKADTDGLEATLHWLQTRPGTDAAKDKWLLRLLMARVAEQKGKNELALHLLGELDDAAQSITLRQWTPALLFEVKSRRLRLLRMKASRSETDKSRLQPEMDLLLSGLIALDPASSAVLCG